MSRLSLVCALGVVIAGCSTLSVTKIDPDDTETKGVRFSLPRPYLLVTPKPDGTIEVKDVYLPDPQATFAADAASYMATHTLDLELSEGVLTIATWKADTTGVVAQALETGSTVAKTMLEEQAKAEAAGGAERVSAQKAEADAADGLRVAEAVAKANPTPENLAKLAAARVVYENTRARSLSFANAADAQAGVWGPILYAIDDELDAATKKHTVTLTAVEAFDEAPKVQKRFPASKPPPPAAAPTDYFPKGMIVPKRPKAGEPREFTIEASNPIKEFLRDRTRLRVRTAGGLVEVPLASVLTISHPEAKKLLVVVADAAPNGEYELAVRVKLPDDSTEGPLFEFKLQP